MTGGRRYKVPLSTIKYDEVPQSTANLTYRKLPQSIKTANYRKLKYQKLQTTAKYKNRKLPKTEIQKSEKPQSIKTTK